MVQAALRCLNAITDAVALEEIDVHQEIEELLKAVYNVTSLANLNRILNQESSNPIIQNQITLTTELIAKTSNNERRRKQIKISGIFNSLANRLATFVVTSAQLKPDQSTVGGLDIIPANRTVRLAPLLQAICSVIADSKIRASEFCCYAVWGDVFPNQERDIYSWRAPPATQIRVESETNSTLSSEISAAAKLSSLVNQDSSSRWISLGYPSGHSSYPVWGVGQLMKDSYATGHDGRALEGFNARDEDDTPLVAWLINVVRTTDSITRLMAIWFISLLFRSQMIGIQRQRSLSMLLVPILINMLDSELKMINSENSMSQPLAKTTRRLMAEIAPRVLAFFVEDNNYLQKSAADGGAIKKLSQLLKQSFDPISPNLVTPMWTAYAAEEQILEMDPHESSLLGRQGISPIVHHSLQVRESFLIAIGAMATLSDANRQTIIDNGVVPFLIESLKPAEPRFDRHFSPESVKPANSISTVVAACGAVRTLSRSVAILRTSLVDAGLPKPICNLLRHSDRSVQIAATEAVTNIVLPFSAMREDIIRTGVVLVLCEHAHSSEAKLRISALWALGNLVVDASNDLKLEVIRELTPGWLNHIISTGVADEAISGRFHDGNGFGMTTANSSGEQVDILNAMDNKPQAHQHDKDSGSDVNMYDSAGSLEKSGQSSGHFSGGFAIVSDEYFEARADERTAAIQAARDDLAVQEQGLVLVRNLLVGGAGISTVVDYLFVALGQDKLFDIFTNLLRPKSMDGFRGQDRRLGSISTSKLVPPPTEIVVGVCYILVHVAASGPRHKRMILSQTDLLRLMVPLFTHHHPGVRVALVWFVINMIWKEDISDRDAAMGRALELKKLGIITKVHEAVNDSDMDVRERAKHAIASLADLVK